MATTKKLKVMGRISLGVLALGIVLMAYMIIVESAPGALPLLLVAAGSGAYLISRYRLAKQDPPS